MSPDTLHPFGRADLKVTPFSYGTAPIGNIFREIAEADAQAMIEHAWNAGIRFYDTAPMYGHGLSELRTGHGLRWKNRSDYVLATKVGRILTPARRNEIDFEPWVNAGAFQARFDYSYDGAMRSFEDSMQRMGLEYLDVCYIHDCDRFTHGDEQPARFKEAMAGAAKALLSLRDQGVVKAVGVGVNEWEVCHAALEQHDFDAFLLAGRYTLLEQESLDKFLPLCEQRNAAVVVGGGFNSGILATGAVEGAKYNYAPAPPDVMNKVRGIEEVCREYGVALPAAALQFVVAHPAVASFCAGTRTVDQLQQNLDWFSTPIPSDLWQTLKDKQLLREDAPVPG